MTIEPPSFDLVVRVAGRAMSPSRGDADRIRAALGVVVEVLKAILKLSSDERTAEVLRAEGNGKARGPTEADVEQIIQTANSAIATLQDRELVVEHLRTIRASLTEQSESLKRSFQQRAEDFTPRPVEQAAGHVFTGGLLAGLLDAVSAFDQLLSLLEALDK